MAQTTTYGLILDQMVTAILAITPAKHAGTKFVAHRGEVDFTAWVEQNPNACFRRFEVANNFDYEHGYFSGTANLQLTHGVTLLVAYPQQWGKYGVDNMRDADVLIDSDLAQLDSAIGIPGYSAYVSGHALSERSSVAPVRVAGAWIMQLTYKLQYDRSY